MKRRQKNLKATSKTDLIKEMQKLEENIYLKNKTKSKANNKLKDIFRFGKIAAEIRRRVKKSSKIEKEQPNRFGNI